MNTVVDKFFSNVERLGEKPCFRYKENGEWKALSWEEAGEKVLSCAGALQKLGVVSGDRVGIISYTRYEWTVADLAILSIGAVAVPIYHSVNASEVEYIVRDAGISVIFVEKPALLEKIKRLQIKQAILFEGEPENAVSFKQFLSSADLKTCRPEDLLTDNQTATIIYTSGTTGVPKGVVLTHRNIAAQSESLIPVFDLGVNDTMLSFLPLAHVLARSVQYFQLSKGFVSAYAESIDALQKNFRETSPTLVIVVPRIIEKIYERIQSEVERVPLIKRKIFGWAVKVGFRRSRMLRRGEKPSVILKLKYSLAHLLVFAKLHESLGGNLKFIVSGGAPLAPELAKFFHAVGLLVLEGYGLTETVAAILVNRPDDYRLGTVGKPLPGVDIRLSEDGEVEAKGEMIFGSYYKLEQDTRAAFTVDGWFKTGDIGEFTKDGFLRITGRIKDLIITAGGKNISPQKIEQMISESGYVSNVSVYGDKRKYLTALITLNFENVRRYADEKGVEYSSDAELSKKAEVIDLIASVVEEKNKLLASYETIKKFAILEHDFTINSGELTPSLKVKRAVVAKKFEHLLNSLYA